MGGLDAGAQPRDFLTSSLLYLGVRNVLRTRGGLDREAIVGRGGGGPVEPSDD